MEDTNPTARRWAARDLATTPRLGRAGAASAAGGGHFGARGDPQHADVLGDELAVAGLVDCLASEDVALRNEAIEAMKQLPDEVASIMRGLLADANPDVRIFAVNVLESLRHPEVESWLITVIERDPT